MSLLERLFGRRANPKEQIGLFGEQQAEVEGFALVSPKGKPTGRAQPGQGTQSELVSRKVSREQMERMRERELEERRAKKKRRKQNDAYDDRAAKAENVRPGVREAAAAIARIYKVPRDHSPVYIAQAIEEELQRFERDPDALILKVFQDRDPFTNLSYRDMARLLEESTNWIPPDIDETTSKAVRAAAARLSRTLSAEIVSGRGVARVFGFNPFVEFLHMIPSRIVEHLQAAAAAPASRPGVDAALQTIQEHRRAIGMRPLDTVAAGWTEEDILIEADRLRRLPNPLQDLKHRLI